MGRKIQIFGIPSFSYAFRETEPETIDRADMSFARHHVVEPVCRWFIMRFFNNTPGYIPILGSISTLAWYVGIFWISDSRFIGGVNPWMSFMAGVMLTIHLFMIHLAHLTLGSDPFMGLLYTIAESMALMHLVVLTASVVQAGPWFATVAFFAAAVVLFDVHWESMHTGTLVYSPWASPVEMHFIAIFLCFSNALLPGLWAFPLAGGFTLGRFLILLTLVGSLILTGFSVRRVIKREITPDRTRDALLEWVPMAVIGVGALGWQLLVRDVFLEHPHPFIISLVLIFVYTLSRTLLNYMVNEPVHLIFAVSVVPIVMTLVESVGLHDSATMIYVILFLAFANLLAFSITIFRYVALRGSNEQ